MTTAEASDPYDFSLVLGGPLYQLVRRAHLSGDALEHLRRRIVVIALFAWLPPFLLSVVAGRAWGSAVQVPFVMDVEVHTRLLLAVPLLIVAELVVHQRMRHLIRQFLERDLIAEESRARFDAAVASALRLRNSIVAELLLIAFVYVGIVFLWPHYAILHASTWYSLPGEGGYRLTPAGWWLAYVSVPIFQFLLFRWYFRIFIWIRFLSKVARCRLKLVPTHPDRAGGLGFLTNTAVAFAPLLAAHGVLLSGFLANRIFFQSAVLTDFKLELAAVVLFLLLIVVGPLLFFTPHLATARRVGLREYGTLAGRYVREFDSKWLRGTPPAEPLVGSADIQSLADLANSFEVIRSMSMVPFTRQTVVQLAVITLLPVAPLLLTMISLEELMQRLLQVVL
ncbi:MAG TPA: hypothetical protein VJU81_21355 [Methylomirabilota bacterium]|nr:hypothetical protein [Methylomirabilota bacterium]